MNKKTVLSIMLSIMFGIGAILIARNWLEINKPEAAENQVYVAIATMNIPTGTEVDAKHVVLKVLPTSLSVETTIQNLEDAYGKIAKEPIYAGDIIRKERLFIKGEGSTLASLISENMRAITIRVNDVVGVAGFLLPGNRVDILNTSQHKNKVTTEVVLANIKILAIDQRAAQNENTPQLVRAVTVEVNLKQAEALLTAKSKGSLQLALRNPIDNYALPNTTVPDIINKPISHNAQNTKKSIRKPTSHTRQNNNRKVEIIRGTTLESVQLKI
ncbi:Flp pilus assembly protein CpaB [Moritella sp. 24]|uniref:Flp pilus assembly protein CpaB n=1 Tax=Moritella sp. 24 TaxID=2746230 RepID=UPI001BA5F70A|nr:Flp pilus assembly protein CpaB [Moritella sp. 24]QUM76587.1 Flp pilus assembly protein CpaB [Moritella sp. 24]